MDKRILIDELEKKLGKKEAGELLNNKKLGEENADIALSLIEDCGSKTTKDILDLDNVTMENINGFYEGSINYIASIYWIEAIKEFWGKSQNIPQDFIVMKLGKMIGKDETQKLLNNKKIGRENYKLAYDLINKLGIEKTKKILGFDNVTKKNIDGDSEIGIDTALLDYGEEMVKAFWGNPKIMCNKSTDNAFDIVVKASEKTSIDKIKKLLEDDLVTKSNLWSVMYLIANYGSSVIDILNKNKISSKSTDMVMSLAGSRGINALKLVLDDSQVNRDNLMDIARICSLQGPEAAKAFLTDKKINSDNILKYAKLANKKVLILY